MLFFIEAIIVDFFLVFLEGPGALKYVNQDFHFCSKQVAFYKCLCNNSI